MRMHVCARVLLSRVHRDWYFEAFVDVKMLEAGDDLLSSAAGKPPEFRGGVHLFIYTAIRHRGSPEFKGTSELFRWP